MVKSFSQRLAVAQRAAALKTMTLTERLLAHILIELMETRSRRDYADITHRLTTIGLTKKQVAALLNTTPASLAALQHRKVRAAADREEQG